MRYLALDAKVLKTALRRLRTAPAFGRWKPAACAFLLIAALAPPSPAGAQDAPTPVIATRVTTETIEDRIEALGTLRANEQVTLTAQVTEIVSAVKFRDGQRVKEGDVLVEMSSAEERALLDEAEATAEEAKEQMDRIERLQKRGVSAQATLSERTRDYLTAKARLHAMRSRLGDRSIRAPFAGVLGFRQISVGALLEPGTVITTIDDDSVMKLDFDVPATALSSLEVGLDVVATSPAYGDKIFTGKITAIDSRIDPVTRTIKIRAQLPNPDATLKAGTLMTLEVLRNKRSAVVIPERAIVALGRESFVYVVNQASDPPTAQRRKVTIGTRFRGRVEVVDGLAEGELIVIDGIIKLRPDSSISFREISPDEPLATLLKSKPRNPS